MEDYTAILNKQETLAKRIRNFQANVKKGKAESEQTINSYEEKLSFLEQSWFAFDANQDKLYSVPETLKKEKYFSENQYEAIVEDYLKTRIWLKEKISALQLPTLPQLQVPSVRTSTIMSHCEKLKLPRFDGKQKNWDSFKDSFEALIISDDSIPNIVKFQQLINSLDESAAHLLKGIEIVEHKFAAAWQLLCETYNNRFLRFSSHMDALVGLPSSTKETPEHLSTLLSTVNEAVCTFKALKLPVEKWDTIIIYHLVNKLADNTRREWVRKVDTDPKSTKFPHLEAFKEFLQGRIRESHIAQGLKLTTKDDNISTTKLAVDNYKNRNHRSRFNASTHTTVAKKSNNFSSKRSCALCAKDHFLGYCPDFSNLPVTERYEFVKDKKLCFNCLYDNHFSSRCEAKMKCFICRQRHHTKLHKDKPTTINVSSTVPASSAVALTSTVVNCVEQTQRRNSLLATAVVQLENEHGVKISVRALLDPCAEESIVSEYVVQALRLTKERVSVRLTGSGGSLAAVSNNRINLILKSDRHPEFSLPLSALVLSKVTQFLPTSVIIDSKWSHLKGLELADPLFGIPGRVDCILNSFVFGQVILPGLKRNDSDIHSPVAMNSKFGWILMGSVGWTQSTSNRAVHVTLKDELLHLLEQFWELEEVPTTSSWSPDEQSCYAHFKTSHRRDETGRFIVRLPFKKPPELKGTKPIAMRLFNNLERRLRGNDELASSYSAFIEEYQTLQHLETLSGDTSEGCFLPHHAVLNLEKKKIRVVFNASQKDERGNTLNDYFHVGPKLQLDIITVLSRWSFSRFVVTCDIVKMFRQFLVDPSDRKWLQILWRWSPDQPISVLRLSTVTYGTSCAPFLSNACLLQLAEDGEDLFPKAAKVIKKNRYVDDFFMGSDTKEEAEELKLNLTDLLKTAGMELDKFACNYKNCEDQTDEVSISIVDDQLVSLLGLYWNPSDDTFRYKCKELSEPLTISKRAILSKVASLFDPIGWLAPVVIRAKILLQCLWMLGCDWDDIPPTDICKQWKEFLNELSDLKLIKIPRWANTLQTSVWEIHGFCDASERAYGAAIYLVVRSEQNYTSKLMLAKSKVAPIKVVSISKLELCAAHLLTKLLVYFLSVLESQPVCVRCWSDSKNVLSWLSSHPSKWKCFVANRVSDIKSLLPHAVWDHVVSGDNPADLVSRGCSPRVLSNSELWWCGPKWLSQESQYWPKSDNIEETTLEKRSIDQSLSFVTCQEDSFSEWLKRFSSISKVVAVIAYCLRWRAIVKKVKLSSSPAFLTAEELRIGRQLLIRIIQEEVYQDEYRDLKRNQIVALTSSLKRFLPFIDSHGIIRVGGRLQNSTLSEDEKHPILLPKNHILSELLIWEAHKLTLHGGEGLVRCILSQRYWIVQGRNFIRKILRSCVICARERANVLNQQMAPLPAIRTIPSRPFSSVGVDYAGPFFIKRSQGRGARSFKGYVAVFVCLVVKAVHLELVSDYSTADFIAAFRRFTSRRGLCQVVYSDHGTTFHGADAELKRLFKEGSTMLKEVESSLARDGISWKYVPPKAPHFGGLWESNVKSFKLHLKRILGITRVTFEEFATLLSQIEACLNSRPLSAFAEDYDQLALTPGHFLIGAPLLSIPSFSPDENANVSLLSRWNHLQVMLSQFWKRWSKDYLNQLQQRAKWLKPNHDFAVGDIVLIKDNLMSVVKWPLARIVKTHIGQDGLCRVVTVKTASSEFVRPIHKLVLLPVNERATAHLSVSCNL